MKTRISAGEDVSTLLQAWTGGDHDQKALDRLTPLVYHELHRLARRYMRREHTGHSLQTTALVNEAYLRLVDYKRMQWQSRAHFFAVSAQLMRRILVDRARRHNLKRGAGYVQISRDDSAALDEPAGEHLMALDDALTALAHPAPAMHKSIGNFDVYVSRRSSTRKRWSPPINLGRAVNSPGSETRATISWDSSRLYFGRDGDIYSSTRRFVPHWD